MTANQCPTCGEVALSFWQKATLGPAKSKPCRNCGAKLSISWRSAVILFAPPIIALVLAQTWLLPIIAEAGFSMNYLVPTAIAGVAIIGLVGYLQHNSKLIEV